MDVEVSIFTPDHVHSVGAWGEFYLLTHEPPAIPGHVDARAVESLLASHHHEWSAILVLRTPQGAAHKIFLWRALNSAFDIYYVFEGRSLYLSDCFAGCARKVSADARRPSDDAVIDHFLFRVILGENTYFERIKRAGYGMRIEIDAASGGIDKRQFMHCRPRGDVRSEEKSLDAIDAALHSATQVLRDKQYAVLFSGGIDSTLLATYLPGGRLITNTITTPEFAKELVYARSAATLLGKEPHVNTLREEDYFERLEEVIDKLWMPPHHAQTVILSEAFRREPARFATGDYADGLFGFFRFKQAYYGPWLAKRTVAAAMDLFAKLPIRKLRRAIRELDPVRAVAPAFRIPALQPGSFASRQAIYVKPVNLERLFSRSEIDRRLQARFEYVSRIVDFRDTSSRKEAQFEVAQLTSAFCSDAMSVWRQLASLYGKSLCTPFVHPQVIKAALSISVPLRYMDNRNVKHLLKKLLERRLPGYPVNQVKLGGVVPIQRYAVNGPLENWQERYPVPEFVDRQTLQHFLETDRGAYWHTILFAVWTARIATSAAQNSAGRKAA